MAIQIDTYDNGFEINGVQQQQQIQITYIVREICIEMENV